MTSAPFDLDTIRRRLAGRLSETWAAIMSPPRDPASSAAIADMAALAAPVVWLIGKVQSGKSSIVGALTGASAAEIGNGFRACTRTASIFDFPSDAPVIRFLDTRGLGEAGYDPAADIRVAESQAHLLLVVMRAADPAQDAIVDVMRQVRQRHPDWPVLVAQTTLHDAYRPGENHPATYPFNDDGLPKTGQELPGDLARLLAHQRSLFEKLPGRGPIVFTPLDFTRPGDGLEPRLFGFEALGAALRRVAPAAISNALTASSTGDVLSLRAHPHILGYATAAAAVDVLPVAGAIAVPGIQAKMLHSLGEIYAVTWDRRMVAEFGGALGTGVLVRLLSSFGARQLGKLIPVYGQTAGAAAAAAMSFATTFALGKAAAMYLDRKRTGGEGASDVQEVYEAALKRAFDISRDRVATAGTQDGRSDKPSGHDRGPAT